MKTLILTVLLFGQPPVEVTPQTKFEFKEHEPIEFSVTEETPEGFTLFIVDWNIQTLKLVNPEGSRARGREYEGGQKYAIWAEPGDYELQLLLIYKMGDEGLKIKKYFDIHVQGARPPPPLVVSPIDSDPNTKKVSKAIVVYDQTQNPISPYVPAARGKIEDNGIEYRVTDKNPRTGEGTIPQELRPALNAAAEAGSYPYLVLLDEEGTIIRSLKCPSTTQGIVDEVIK